MASIVTCPLELQSLNMNELYSLSKSMGITTRELRKI